MPITHTGEESRDGDILGFNAGRYPRKDDNGNKLEGHGIYVLEGDELRDYKARDSFELSPAQVEKRRRDQEIIELRKRFMGDPYQQLAFLASYGFAAFSDKYRRAVNAYPGDPSLDLIAQGLDEIPDITINPVRTDNISVKIKTADMPNSNKVTS